MAQEKNGEQDQGPGAGRPGVTRRDFLDGAALATAGTAAAVIAGLIPRDASAAESAVAAPKPSPKAAVVAAGVSFQFGLDVGGKTVGYFQECTGIGSETEVVEQKFVDGNGIETTKKIPGRLKYNDVTLARGITGDKFVWTWRRQVEVGKMNDARTNCSISMLNQALEPVATWDLANTWPSKVSGPALGVDGDYGVEAVVLTCEGMIRTL